MLNLLHTLFWDHLYFFSYNVKPQKCRFSIIGQVKHFQPYLNHVYFQK